MNDQREPTEEELHAALEEELKRIRVEDVIVQTAVTLVNLAGRKLGLAKETTGERDLGQAKLAIDGARALVPLVPPEPAAAIRDALSSLQMAFAREAQRPPEPAPGAEQPAPGGEQPPAGEQPAEAERAKARAKIWTPPGSTQ